MGAFVISERAPMLRPSLLSRDQLTGVRKNLTRVLGFSLELAGALPLILGGVGVVDVLLYGSATGILPVLFVLCGVGLCLTLLGQRLQKI